MVEGAAESARLASTRADRENGQKDEIDRLLTASTKSWRVMFAKTVREGTTMPVKLMRTWTGAPPPRADRSSHAQPCTVIRVWLSCMSGSRVPVPFFVLHPMRQFVQQ